MICIFVIMLSGWCRTRMRPARLVSNAFLHTTFVQDDPYPQKAASASEFSQSLRRVLEHFCFRGSV